MDTGWVAWLGSWVLLEGCNNGYILAGCDDDCIIDLMFAMLVIVILTTAKMVIRTAASWNDGWWLTGRGLGLSNCWLDGYDKGRTAIAACWSELSLAMATH